jgi:N-acetylneuraminate synthase
MENIRLVAEFTTNHLGNFNLLTKMVEKAAWADCSLIKMQKKEVGTFYSPEKLATPYKSPYGKTYAEYREIFEFDKHNFQKFDAYCKEHNVPWFATVQDIPSLEFLLQFNLDIYKIASLNIRNSALITAVISQVRKDKEIVLSVGGATLKEIESILNHFTGFRKITILHCVAEYPCEPQHLRLGNITELQCRFSASNVEIGYSGHEEGYIPSLVAVGLGVKMVERHFCISRASFAHHIECSLEPDEFKQMAKIVSSKSGNELLSYQKKLPREAMESYFGMSEIESDFLIKGRYGTKYIKDSSEIHAE